MYNFYCHWANFENELMAGKRKWHLGDDGWTMLIQLAQIIGAHGFPKTGSGKDRKIISKRNRAVIY